MKTKLAQSIMMGIQGMSISAEEKKFIIENNIGGVILFSRNYKEPKQLHELCTELRSLSLLQKDKLPLFIGIDQEGGRVQRIKTAPFTVWPPLAMAGKIDNTMVTFRWANLLSEELTAFGINLNFAPSLDIFTRTENKVIGDRAISNDFRIVEKHASAWVRGALKAEILSCAKHFPGHGNTILDSHVDLPIENVSLDDLMARELIPFKKAFRSKIDFVMLSHIIYPQIDAKWPASLSRHFVQEILRQTLSFRGLIITDDLDMGALTKNYSKPEIAVKAYEAGSEILLYCNEPESPLVAIESLIEAYAQGRIQESAIDQVYLRIAVEKKEKLSHFPAMTYADALKIIQNPERQKFADQIRGGQVPNLDIWKP